MTDTCNTNRTDLFCGRAALVIWGIPGAILVATASWRSPLLVVIWPALLVWMGGACLINAKRCGRRHCYATGPFFLALAVVSLLYGLRLLPLGPQGWGTLSIVLLVGSCVLTFVPEWIWGRYMAADHSRP